VNAAPLLAEASRTLLLDQVGEDVPVFSPISRIWAIFGWDGSRDRVVALRDDHF
jgi:hypothetical protein